MLPLRQLRPLHQRVAYFRHSANKISRYSIGSCTLRLAFAARLARL
jgi:hypothetical protein